MPRAAPKIRPHRLRRRTIIGGLAALAGTAGVRSAAASESITIGGTGMALAAMRQIGEAFTAQTQIVVKVLPSLGTSGGLAAAAAGALDIALSARPLSEADRGKGLQGSAYGTTPIAFCTRPDTDIDSITLHDVIAIFTGRTASWPNGTPVRLIRREPSDADWTMLRSISPEMAEAVTAALQRPGLLTAATDQDNADALERLPGSFGAISIGQLRAEDRRVVALRLDGAPPTVEALIGGTYPLSRTLYLAWRAPPQPKVAQFVGFVRSDAISELLIRLGHIPNSGAPG